MNQAPTVQGHDRNTTYPNFPKHPEMQLDPISKFTSCVLCVHMEISWENSHKCLNILEKELNENQIVLPESKLQLTDRLPSSAPWHRPYCTQDLLGILLRFWLRVGFKDLTARGLSQMLPTDLCYMLGCTKPVWHPLHATDSSVALLHWLGFVCLQYSGLMKGILEFKRSHFSGEINQFSIQIITPVSWDQAEDVSTSR